MSPESQPKVSSSSVTWALAPASSPQRKAFVVSPSESGATITAAFIVFSAFTTRASGNAR